MGTIGERDRLAADGVRTRTLVALGDAAIVAAVLAYGIVDHYGVSYLSNVGSVVETLGPFLLGWLVCAPLAGVYAADVLAGARTSVRLTAVCWIAAANVGLSLRTAPHVSGGVTWPFGLVVTGFVLVALLPWRYAVARYLGGVRGRSGP